MATEIRPPRPETDEDLLTRAPAHDGVATQRDLRETERYLVAISTIDSTMRKGV